jgi:hypothetical protein
MKVKTEPLLTAVTVGIIIQLVYYLAYLLSVYSVYNQALKPEVLAPTFSNILTSLGCVMLLVSGTGTGFLYAWLHGRSGPVAPVAARGGATAGAITFALGIFITGILTAVVLLPIIGSQTIANASAAELAAGDSVQRMLGLGAAGIVGGTFCLAGVTAVLGAMLGGLGGGLGGVWLQRREA